MDHGSTQMRASWMWQDPDQPVIVPKIEPQYPNFAYGNEQFQQANKTEEGYTLSHAHGHNDIYSAHMPQNSPPALFYPNYNSQVPYNPQQSNAIKSVNPTSSPEILDLDSKKLLNSAGATQHSWPHVNGYAEFNVPEQNNRVNVTESSYRYLNDNYHLQEPLHMPLEPRQDMAPLHGLMPMSMSDSKSSEVPSPSIKRSFADTGNGPPKTTPSNVKRPKTHHCTTCDSWFTSAGHLKRHYNTTRHKSAQSDLDKKQLGSTSIRPQSSCSNGSAMSVQNDESRMSFTDDVASNTSSAALYAKLPHPTPPPAYSSTINPSYEVVTDSSTRWDNQPPNFYGNCIPENYYAREYLPVCSISSNGNNIPTVSPYPNSQLGADNPGPLLCSTPVTSTTEDALNGLNLETVESRETNPVSPDPSSSSSPDSLVDSKSGKFSCKDCSKHFAKMCYLTQHRSSYHEGEKLFKCNKCGKRYATQSLHDKHQIKHEGIKPFKCEMCIKAFNHKTDLRRHMCLHTGEKPFRCCICDKGFIRKDHMTKHKEIHNKTKNNQKNFSNNNVRGNSSEQLPVLSDSRQEPMNYGGSMYVTESNGSIPYTLQQPVMPIQFQNDSLQNTSYERVTGVVSPAAMSGGSVHSSNSSNNSAVPTPPMEPHYFQPPPFHFNSLYPVNSQPHV